MPSALGRAVPYIKDDFGRTSWGRTWGPSALPSEDVCCETSLFLPLDSTWPSVATSSGPMSRSVAPPHSGNFGINIWLYEMWMVQTRNFCFDDWLYGERERREGDVEKNSCLIWVSKQTEGSIKRCHVICWLLKRLKSGPQMVAKPFIHWYWTMCKFTLDQALWESPGW